MLVRLRTAPPLIISAAELMTDSTVEAAAVDSSPIVSPCFRLGPAGRASSGGARETNTSPRGVAERNWAVLPMGSCTPSMMRKVTTAT
ncbi:Uncharacterised protein [Mycobacteroides abscessus subsp. abscessus]|nr:Uncharacterised protein [Mycobacteroides abscessus subsp. abscessus]